jgi:hypothetical protein
VHGAALKHNFKFLPIQKMSIIKLQTVEMCDLGRLISHTSDPPVTSKAAQVTNFCEFQLSLSADGMVWVSAAKALRPRSDCRKFDETAAGPPLLATCTEAKFEQFEGLFNASS